MNAATTVHAVDPPMAMPGSLWAEQELARRAAIVLAAAREEHLRDALGGLVGDLVEAAAALALAVLGERGMLHAEPALPDDPEHRGWAALQDAVMDADPNVVLLDEARAMREAGVPERWFRQAVQP